MSFVIDIDRINKSIEEQDFKSIYVIDDEIDMAHFIGKIKKYFNNSLICYINDDVMWNKTNYNTVSKLMLKHALINDMATIVSNKNIKITIVVPTYDNLFHNKLIINIHYSYITVCRYSV